MLMRYLKCCCSIIAVLSLYNTANATIAYKWLDDIGQVNFSQQAPDDREADIIRTRPGPVVDPAQFQESLDQLIEQQAVDAEVKKQTQLERQQEAEKIRTTLKNCDAIKSNLKKYQDNPIGLIKGLDGEYDRIDEIERQKKMQQLSQEIQTHCE
ncbi:MAG: hypothetical protein ACI9QV_000572 [Methylophagaceae bacterium]|jgi:hypothetical protein